MEAMTTVDLKSMSPAEIDRFCVQQLGKPPGQGLRVAVQLFRKQREIIDGMTDLNRAFREALKQRCRISLLAVERADAAQDGTVKLLYRLANRQRH